jgi:23S rRNA (guanosine2251-2'-O)-methyltransferase
MAVFEVRQCTDRACGLRMPIETEIHLGLFCPMCGAPMQRIGEPFQNVRGLVEEDFKTPHIEVLLDNIRSAYNVGAIFRTADGIGIRHIYLCGITPNPDDSDAIKKTALGAADLISWSTHPDACALAEALSAKGHRLVALEATPGAIPVNQFRPENLDQSPLVLVVGNERAGVDPGVIDQCERVLMLPMIGTKASLNVAVAFGAAAYWLMLANQDRQSI